MMKALVTGGAGFIGSHLVDRLIAAGMDVAVIDDLSTGRRENLNSRARFHEVKVEDADLARVFGEECPDIVFHLAAQKDVRASVDAPRADAMTNVIGLLNILERTLQLKGAKFVFASSGGVVYGESNSVPTEESHPPFPLSPYGVAKLAGELYLRCYEEWNALAYTSLRYANVYGPRQDPEGEGGVVAIFAGQMLTGRPSTIYGDGSMTRDYVYVDDVVEATLRAVDAGTGECINIGTAQETSVQELYDKMRSITAFEGSPEYLPKRPGELQRSCLSIEKARQVLGWRPRVQLEEGLVRTLDWFRNRKGL
jgi:UDP-glucose 4-epimerase